MCRSHGGKSPGAPKGEANGNYRHGGDTQEAIAERKRIRALLDAVKDGGTAEPAAGLTDWQLMQMLLQSLGVKETRAMRSARNKAAWSQGDRRAWGGEDRRGWPKRPGRNGYRWRR